MVHQLILKLIQQKKYEDQTQILHDLTCEGVQITQSTLSRHFQKLGIRKKNGFYVSERPAGISGIISVVEAPPNLIIIKTMPGHASAVAFMIEEQNLTEVLGTIAGDDTIMLAVLPENLKALVGKLIKK